MKELSAEQMQQINGGSNVTACAAAAVAGFGMIALSGVTGGLGLFLGGLFFSSGVGNLVRCVS
jgi:bacteriocin-like protein